jgi:hypothetical protein
MSAGTGRKDCAAAQAQENIATNWKAAWIKAGRPGLQKLKVKTKKAKKKLV